MYCHGWKNNSQSEDVIKFNSFLAKIASSEEVIKKGFRVHGVYLSWRGNVVPPYIDKSDPFYKDCLTNYGAPIVDQQFDRSSDWMGVLPENADFYNRQHAAEHLVSGLPMARAIFTYASTAKDYGRKLTNQVVVMGHSMGALMLERSLGQAMTGSIVMEWWDGGGLKNEAIQQRKPALPFDFVLLLNSAAPSIYAKEMSDFLEADRNAPHSGPGRSAPVIVSLTSTADCATGFFAPAANILAPLRPSLQRQYTNGIFGTTNQWHPPIAQWKFYWLTPGHQPLLINHWVNRETNAVVKANVSPDEIFEENISQSSTQDPYVFFTSPHGQYKAAVWRVSTTNQLEGKLVAPVTIKDPVTLKDLPLTMRNSDYWIMNCDGELIANHGDIWSTTTMEMYAGLYRLAMFLKNTPQQSESALAPGH